jgi:hypothetical protein
VATNLPGCWENLLEFPDFVIGWLHFFYELSSLHEEWTSYYACPRIYLKKEVDCPQEPTVKDTIVEAIFF